MKKLKIIKYRQKCLLVFMVMCLFGVSACSMENKVAPSEDILTMKETKDGRTQITVLVKHAFSIRNFEKIVEEKFADIDLVQVGNYTANTALAKEFEARLEHDDLTDIVMTWPLDVGQEYWDDRLIDMSGMGFSSQYKKSMLDSISTADNSLYFIPGPAEIRAIVYNKTMFNENGWQVPTSYTEFLSLCKQIEETGIRSFQLSLGNKEVLDTAFIGFNYGNAYSKPSDSAWLEDYNNGNGKFIDHFDSALDTFQELIDLGIYRESDLKLKYADTQSNLFNRKTAMTEDSILLTKMHGVFGEETNDEFALMPFFNKEPDNDWARLYMTCFIGMNKHLQESANQDKYDKVLKLMEYISSKEGQIALASDNEGVYSSLKGMDAPYAKEIVNLESVLNEGRYGVFPTFERCTQAFREGLKAMVEKKMTGTTVAQYIDEANSRKPTKQKEIVYGEASEDFTLSETGAFFTDVMREEADSDFALFLDNGKDENHNGKGVSAKIYKGDITQTDLDRIFPDLRYGEQGELWKAEIKGKDLMRILEYTMPIGNDVGWFYYVSGLKMKFNPLAKPGSRIQSLATMDGKKVKKDKVYSVAMMEDSLPIDVLISIEKKGVLIQDLLAQKIQKEKVITPIKDGRFKIVNDK